MKKYGSWCITLSTKEPVEGIIQDTAVKWLSKFAYCYAVIEGGAGTDKERHLHAQIWCEPIEKQSLVRFWKRKFDSGFAPDSIFYHAIQKGIKIAFNDDFLTEYMDKDVQEVLLSEVPRNTLEYYPSVEEQQEVQAETNSKNKDYFCLKKKFFATGIDRHLQITPESIANWIFLKMYKDDEILIIKDKKKRGEYIMNFYYYIRAQDKNKPFVLRLEDLLPQKEYEKTATYREKMLAEAINTPISE